MNLFSEQSDWSVNRILVSFHDFFFFLFLPRKILLTLILT